MWVPPELTSWFLCFTVYFAQSSHAPCSAFAGDKWALLKLRKSFFADLMCTEKCQRTWQNPLSQEQLVSIVTRDLRECYGDKQEQGSTCGSRVLQCTCTCSLLSQVHVLIHPWTEPSVKFMHEICIHVCCGSNLSLVCNKSMTVEIPTSI